MAVIGEVTAQFVKATAASREAKVAAQQAAAKELPVAVVEAPARAPKSKKAASAAESAPE